MKGRNPPIQKDVIATSVSVEHNPTHGTEHIQPEGTKGNGMGLSSNSGVGRPDDVECGCIDPIENSDEPIYPGYPIELETIEDVPEPEYFDQKDCVCIWSNEGKECFRFGCYIGSRRISDHAVIDGDDLLKPMVDLEEFVGKGRRSYNNGEYYDGSLFHGLRHGIGYMIDRKGVQYNPGMYSNDMYMGRVVYSDCPLNNLNDESLHYVRIQYKNGSEYEGQLRNGMINGQGILKSGDGATKEGTFWHNSFLGEVHTFDDLDHDLSDLDSYSGEISISNGHIQFSGHWDRGSLEGSGRLSVKNNYTYSGEWHENVQHGRGVMILASGDTYRGNFTNGLFDDPDGSYEFSDGSIYKGSFKLGIRNGTGSFTHRNGCNLKGTWKQGNIEGDVDLFYEQEHVGIGQVIHDRCIVEEKLHNNSRIAEMVSSLDLRLKIIRAPSANDNKPHKKCYEDRQDQGNHPKKNTYDIGFGSPNIAHYDSFNWGDVSW